jgi:hypothetical protein
LIPVSIGMYKFKTMNPLTASHKGAYCIRSI